MKETTTTVQTGSLNNASMLKSINRCLDIIEALAEERRGISLKQLALKVKMNQSTVFRVLNTLLQRGYVEQDPTTRQYSLGIKILELGSSLLEEMELYTQILPFMGRLREECDETVALGILRDGGVFILASVSGSLPDSVYVRQGGRYPFHCTALGKVLCAYLAEDELDQLVKVAKMEKYTSNTVTDRVPYTELLQSVRRAGLAIEDEEFLEGMVSLAAPLRNHQGKVVAGLSILLPKIRYKCREEELAALLKRFASHISQRFGYVPKGLFID